MKLLMLLLLAVGWCGYLEAKELRIPKGTKNVNQLHDELLEAFPSWKGTSLPTGGFKDPLLGVQASDTEIILIVPDNADNASIHAVMNAHTPKLPSPDPDAELTLAIQDATTLQELKDALLGKTRAGKIKAR